MFGTPSQPGIIPQMLTDIFDYLNSVSTLFNRVTVKVSFYQIYNERIHDILTNQEVYLRSDSAGNVSSGVEEREVLSYTHFKEIYDQGRSNLKVASTALNIASSRSHVVLCVSVEMESDIVVRSKMNLVDLAGSENNRKTLNDKERMKESANINRSLFVLHKVVNAIVNGEKRIPYRDSKLTRVLQDSIGGSSVTVIIGCVCLKNLDEVKRTLDFVSLSGKIVNKIIVNEVCDKGIPFGNKLKMNTDINLVQKSTIDNENTQRNKFITKKVRIKNQTLLNDSPCKKLLKQNNSCFKTVKEKDTLINFSNKNVKEINDTEIICKGTRSNKMEMEESYHSTTNITEKEKSHSKHFDNNVIFGKMDIKNSLSIEDKAIKIRRPTNFINKENKINLKTFKSKDRIILGEKNVNLINKKFNNEFDYNFVTISKEKPDKKLNKISEIELNNSTEIANCNMSRILTSTKKHNKKNLNNYKNINENKNTYYDDNFINTLCENQRNLFKGLSSLEKESYSNKSFNSSYSIISQTPKSIFSSFNIKEVEKKKNDEIFMTPKTKEKSYKAFLTRAESFEKCGKIKKAVEDYKTLIKIKYSKEIEDKLKILTKKKENLTLNKNEVLETLNSGDFLKIKKIKNIGDKRAEKIINYTKEGNKIVVLEELNILLGEKIVKKIITDIY
ncbi:hypothetical protein COBT_000175 [Conglomerata obtusa]